MYCGVLTHTICRCHKQDHKDTNPIAIRTSFQEVLVPLAVNADDQQQKQKGHDEAERDDAPQRVVVVCWLGPGAYHHVADTGIATG